jgi:GGDEF domain-containing protein
VPNGGEVRAVPEVWVQNVGMWALRQLRGDDGWAFALLAFWLALLLSDPAGAQHHGLRAVPAGSEFAALIRVDAPAGVAYDAPAQVWRAPDSRLGIESVAVLPDQAWATLEPTEAQLISHHRPIWLRLRVAAKTPISEREAQAGWLLQFPSVVIDRYTVYRRDAQGLWRAQSAGDRVAHLAWPQSSLSPQFALPISAEEVAAGQASLFVRVEHTVPVQVRPRMVWATQALIHDQTQYVVAGLLAGVMLLLLVICAQMSWQFKDRVYAWYGVYLLFSLLSALYYTGVAQSALWPGATKFSSDAAGVGVLGSFGAFVMFAHSMFGRVHGRWHSWVSCGLAGLCFFGVLVLLASERVEPKFWRFMLFTALVFGFVFASVAKAWRKGLKWAGYWLGVYVPYWLAISITVAQSVGLWRFFELPPRTPLWASVIEAVAMLWCIQAYSRDKHAQIVREQAADERDPLTGCLNRKEFEREAQRIFEISRRSQAPAALFICSVAPQHPDRGLIQMEAMMLKSVRLLRSVAREFDVVGRTEETVLAVMMPGVPNDEVFRARLSRLVALGLMVDAHDRNAPDIRFSVAAGNAQGFFGDFAQMYEELNRLLEEIQHEPQGKRIQLLPDPKDAEAPAILIKQEGGGAVG